MGLLHRRKARSGRLCRCAVTLVEYCHRSLVSRGSLPARCDLGGGSLYLRYALSYRDVEELLAERGVTVDHVTVYRWVQRFTPLLIDAARPCRHRPGGRWFVDETYVKVAGRWIYLYRAIDQFGQVIDVLASQKRDLAAIRGFFTRALEHGPRPTEVTTDRAPAYQRVLDELLPAACHVMQRGYSQATKK
jgi:IS6 family transposase